MAVLSCASYPIVYLVRQRPLRAQVTQIANLYQKSGSDLVVWNIERKSAVRAPNKESQRSPVMGENQSCSLQWVEEMNTANPVISKRGPQDLKKRGRLPFQVMALGVLVGFFISRKSVERYGNKAPPLNHMFSCCLTMCCAVGDTRRAQNWCGCATITNTRGTYSLHYL